MTRSSKMKKVLRKEREKYQAEGNMIDEREGNEMVGISMG